MFFLTSVAIGLTIATTAQVSRSLGRGDTDMAAQLGGAGLALMGVTMAFLSIAASYYARPLTALLGAEGRTLDLAVRFMHIVVPSMPVMAVGMSAAALLRAKGDAKRAMYVTLLAGAVTAVLDPLFIFVFNLGIDGAAIVTVISRFALLGIGLYGAIVIHKMVKIPRRQTLIDAAGPYFAIGLPAIMTQLATPVGNAYVTREIASFGDAAVAGWAVIGRLTPLAFGAVFALSGAIGPILGQSR
jgi:Na+-driven multidrug efflux pump